MGSFHHSKCSDNKQCTGSKARNSFIISKSGRKYSHINYYNFTMTLILQDDPITAGAWMACGTCCSLLYKVKRESNVMMAWIVPHRFSLPGSDAPRFHGQVFGTCRTSPPESHWQ